MMAYLSILFTSIFIRNIFLLKLEGFPHLENELKYKDVVNGGLKLVVVGLFTTLIVYPINKYLLEPINYDFLILIFTVLAALSINLLVDQVLKVTKFNTNSHQVGFEFALVNSVVVAAVMMVSSNTNVLSSLFNILGFTLGHFVVMLIILATYPRLNATHTPKSFKGLPLLLITLGLIAMVFMGLAGIL